MVSSASYEARKFGVHSTMPLCTAYKPSPQASFLEGRPHLSAGRDIVPAETRVEHTNKRIWRWL